MVPDTVHTRLLEVVLACDAARARAIVKAAPDVLKEGWPGGGGSSYLHLAASKGCTEVCAVLVEAGLSVDAVAPRSLFVPLVGAADGGHLETVRLLLAHHAGVDGPPDGIATPLMLAAAGGHVAVVEALLDAGAEINRENLRFPQTALDFAEAYRPQGTGQDLVAALLPARGGIQPYIGPHDWAGTDGKPYLEHVERSVGIVNPIPVVQAAADGFVLRKTRFAPKKYEHQLLFTVGLHKAAGVEIGVVLPHVWPLNRSALKLARFSWPANLLQAAAKAVLQGKQVSHGSLLDPSRESLTGIPLPTNVSQWLVARCAALDNSPKNKRMPQTLLLTPVLSPRPLQAAKAQAAAEKMRLAKWKGLAIHASLLDVTLASR